jgi:type IV pilus assembly protein PilC
LTKIFFYVNVKDSMPNFIYKVRDKQGKVSTGSQQTQSEEELISKLQNDGLVVVSLTAEEVKSSELPGLRQLHLRVTIDDLIIFGRQLATMLAAGVTLLKSLEVLSRQVESKALFKAISQIKHDVATGSTFRDALARHPKIFSQFWINMVETGEASGTLPLTLTQLSDYLEVSASMRRKVTSALIYPAVLIALAIAALTIFTVWIIPIFARVFESLNVELPVLTKAVIAFSNLARNYIVIWLSAIGAVIYLLYRYSQTEQGKWQMDQLKFKLPILAGLFQRISIERFASGLATLIESGVPILYGLDIISKAVGNKVMEKAIIRIRDSVRGGKGMAEPLGTTGVFTPMVVQMVAVGEEIGELGKMLSKISEFYRERINTTLNRIGTLIEPVILIFMGIIIGILVISMFLPIFQLALAR